MEEQHNIDAEGEKPKAENTVPQQPSNETENQPHHDAEQPNAETSAPELEQSLEELNKSEAQQAIQELSQTVFEIKQELGKVIVGQTEMIDFLLAGMFTGGHILLEGVPGIAKTLTAKLLSDTLSSDFSRIQFTPDLMPTDVLGTNIFNLKTSDFEFKKGPIFSNLVLIDEINRAPAKTQSSLFEVMEEKQVTIDGETFKMDYPFFVMATQNPVEQEGTYKLPEAQLDRFLFRIKLTYPQLSEEKNILHRFKSDMNGKRKNTLKAVLDKDKLARIASTIEGIFIKDELVDYIANLVHETRVNGNIFLGASPRASLAILNTSKAIAAMAGRDFVTPDDIRHVTFPVLNHRLILTPEREMEGIEVEDVIAEILEKVEIPR